MKTPLCRSVRGGFGFNFLAVGAALLPVLFAGSLPAITLAEYAKTHTPKLFTAKKGIEMPNTTDQTNNLKEGDKALLLSSLDLTDIKGISQLTVEDDGKKMPIKAVKNLHIFLNHNKITELPEEIAELQELHFLYMEYNQLSSLPKALLKMPTLEGMYYTANQFTEIPPFVYDMKWLKKLQFSKNRITALPSQLGNLKELRHFNMSGNQIAVIPETISNLTRLRVCDLSDNQITALPEAFGKVQIVNQLRVRNNPMTTLPAGFATMRATIDVTGTKIDVASLSPELRAKIDTEKPPGSKIEENLIVRKPKKDK